MTSQHPPLLHVKEEEEVEGEKNSMLKKSCFLDEQTTLLAGLDTSAFIYVDPPVAGEYIEDREKGCEKGRRGLEKKEGDSTLQSSEFVEVLGVLSGNFYGYFYYFLKR